MVLMSSSFAVMSGARSSQAAKPHWNRQSATGYVGLVFGYDYLRPGEFAEGTEQGNA